MAGMSLYDARRIVEAYATRPATVPAGNTYVDNNDFGTGPDGEYVITSTGEKLTLTELITAQSLLSNQKCYRLFQLSKRKPGKLARFLVDIAAGYYLDHNAWPDNKAWFALAKDEASKSSDWSYNPEKNTLKPKSSESLSRANCVKTMDRIRKGDYFRVEKS